MCNIVNVLLKNEIQLSKFEDLIGFMKRFMNLQATSSLASRCFEELYKMEDIYRQEGGARVIGKGKIVSASSSSLGGRAGILLDGLPPLPLEVGKVPL